MEKKKLDPKWEYWRDWRKKNEDKARAIQSRYYYSNREKILEEGGYRLQPNDPRAKGPFDPAPLRNKRIQIEAIRSGPFRGFTSSVFDFDDSPLSTSLLRTISPKKNSLSKRTNEIPKRIRNFFTTEETFSDMVSFLTGSSSNINSGIILKII